MVVRPRLGLDPLRNGLLLRGVVAGREVADPAARGRGGHGPGHEHGGGGSGDDQALDGRRLVGHGVSSGRAAGINEQPRPRSHAASGHPAADPGGERGRGLAGRLRELGRAASSPDSNVIATAATGWPRWSSTAEATLAKPGVTSPSSVA